jgi:hypothetical protein
MVVRAASRGRRSGGLASQRGQQPFKVSLHGSQSRRSGQPRAARRTRDARQTLRDQPANRPAPGTAVVTDKGLSGEETEDFFTGPDLGLVLVRPARRSEKISRSFPNWLLQRIEAIIWTLKNRLGLGRHGGRVPSGCGPGSCGACSPSAPRSRAIGRSARQSSDSSSHTITELPVFPGQQSRPPLFAQRDRVSG